MEQNITIQMAKSGEFLDLPLGFSVSFELINPLFSLELGVNSYSFAFPIDDTPKNRRELGFPQVVGRVNEALDFPVVVWLFGNPWQSATLSLKNATHKGATQASLQLEVAQLMIALNDKALSSFSYDGPRVISTNTGHLRAKDMRAHANSLAPGGLDDYIFFPIKNEVMYGIYYQFATQEMNPYDLTTGFKINYTGASEDEPNIANENTLSPFPYLHYILEKVFLESGYLVNKNTPFWTDTELQTLVILNNYLLDEEIVQYIGSLQGWFSVNHFKGVIDLSEHLPEITADELLRELLKYFNLAPIFENGLVSLVFKKDLLDWSQAEDFTAGSLVGYQTDFTYKTGYSLELSRDEDDELWGDDYQALGKRLVTGEVDDETLLPTGLLAGDVGTMYYVRQGNYYTEWALISGSSPASYEWRLFSLRNDTITQGETGNKTEIGISPVGDITSPKKPHINQLVNSDMYYMGDKKPFGLKLCFADGIVGGRPRGRVDDDLGAYNYSLLLHGEYGIFETFHKDWSEYLANGKEVSLPLQMTKAQLLGLRWELPKRVRTQEGEETGFFSRIKLTVTNGEAFGPVSAEMITT